MAAIEERAAGGGNGRVDGAFVLGKQPAPTMREKRLVKAGWPSEGGGVWVAEFDTTWAGVDEEENLVPEEEEWGRLVMARTMDERCGLLRERFRGVFYEDLRDYAGFGFFNAWGSKATGEVGPLLRPDETVDLWRETYYKGYS